jgi:DNA-directed RNA polymerase alpha subunit
VAEEEARRARAALGAIPNIDFMHAELLFQHGYRTVREVADSTLEELMEVDSLTQEQVSEILKNAKEYAEQLGDEADTLGTTEGDSLTDLERLPITVDVREMLMSGGFKTIQSLVEADDDAIRQVSGLDESDVEQIRQAVDNFLRSGTVRTASPV